MANQDLEKVIEQINSSEQTVLIGERILDGNIFYLLKKFKVVTYQDSHLNGLKGMRIQVDDDWTEYNLDFTLTDPGIPVYSFPGNDAYSCKIILGEEAIEQYLKSIDHWEHGVNFRNKLSLWLGTVDTYLNNRLVKEMGGK